MTNEIPWPAEVLAAGDRPEVHAVLRRCRGLSRAGTLPGTLLLVGPAGLGREGLAVGLAAALVCRDEGDPHCECRSCLRVRRGSHPDVTYLDVLAGKTQILIDEQVRPLLAGIHHLPFEGARRVVVVASAHTPPLGADAAAAMLKTFEEPPRHVVFLLLASNPLRVLPTIVSRSVQVRLPARAGHTASGATAGAAADEWWSAATGSEPAAALLGAALAGDGLALVRVAAGLKETTGGLTSAAALLAAEAHRAGPEGAETLLAAAAALLAAEHRRAALHLDNETAAVGALAPLAAIADRS